MPSPTRDAVYRYPRATADGAGLEYVSGAEKAQDLLAALVAASVPGDTTLGRIWIEDSTAVLSAVEPRAEQVAASEQRQDVVAAQEPRGEAATPVEQGADSYQHDGAWVEPWQETVTAGEQRTDRAGAAEPKAETVTPGESSTDAVQAHATLDETGKQETVAPSEQGTDKAGASEAKAESPSVTEARTSPFAAKEQWTETPTVTEARTDKRNMVEARSETPTVTEARTDALAAAGGGGASVSDDFNRANGGLGANWATITGKSAVSISANAATGSNGAARYSGATFSADQYAESRSVGSTAGDGVVVRCASAAGTYYYAIRALTSNETDGVLLYRRVNNGSPAILGEADSTALVLRLEVSGTTLRVLTGAAHGSLSEVLAVTDSTIASGSPGILTAAGVGTDDFYAGDLS